MNYSLSSFGDGRRSFLHYRVPLIHYPYTDTLPETEQTQAVQSKQNFGLKAIHRFLLTNFSGFQSKCSALTLDKQLNQSSINRLNDSFSC